MRPRREPATNNCQTYMVTSETWGRRTLFRSERWATLFIDNLYRYRGSAYLLHEFVIMPDHFHVLMTPRGSLERAVQYIKGGFSFRAKKELGSSMEVWQKGFSDHRIRDAADYAHHIHYIQWNPVRKGICASPAEYLYSSAHAGFELDPPPQGLKPAHFFDVNGAPEGAPFQSTPERLNPVSTVAEGAIEGTPVKNQPPTTTY